jgi:hypothetical protein
LLFDVLFDVLDSGADSSAPLILLIPGFSPIVPIEETLFACIDLPFGLVCT